MLRTTVKIHPYYNHKRKLKHTSWRMHCATHVDFHTHIFPSFLLLLPLSLSFVRRLPSLPLHASSCVNTFLSLYITYHNSSVYTWRAFGRGKCNLGAVGFRQKRACSSMHNHLTMCRHAHVHSSMHTHENTWLIGVVV